MQYENNEEAKCNNQLLLKKTEEMSSLCYVHVT